MPLPFDEAGCICRLYSTTFHRPRWKKARCNTCCTAKIMKRTGTHLLPFVFCSSSRSCFRSGPKVTHLGCRMALTLSNLWSRAHVFHQFNFHRLGESMPHVLLRMVRSGHFYPAGTWVIPSQGRGMVRRRAEACWKMLTDAEHTSMADMQRFSLRIAESATTYMSRTQSLRTRCRTSIVTARHRPLSVKSST